MLSVKDVEVMMLNGQKWVVQVNPLTATAGEVLENILREQEITEAPFYSLCLQLDTNEYCPLANDMKLAKVAPQVGPLHPVICHFGWKFLFFILHDCCNPVT